MATATGIADSAQWMCVNEESLFLHDGLIRVTDLVQLPRDVSTSSETDRENEVVSFDTKDPAELTDRLLSVCGTNNNAYAYSRLLEYRLNALKGLWNAHRQINSNMEQIEKEASSHEESISLLKKQGLWQQPEQVSFSSRVGLLLVFPLLKSQKKQDPELCGETAKLLLNCLRDCPPLSLTKEPGDCLEGLESLLCSWLTEGSRLLDSEVDDETNQEMRSQQQNLAAALVALACARGSTSTIIHTIHLLQRHEGNLGSLPVADILHKLLRLEGGPGCTSSLLGSKHMVCWGFEDLLSDGGKNGDEKEKEKDTTDIGRSLACDGRFLYTTSSHGKGLAKFGSGLGGTLRGFIYAKRQDLGQGWVAHGEDCLIHRALDTDGHPDQLCTLLDQRTLKTESHVEVPPSLRLTTNRVTIALQSDGTHFYWIWCIVGADKSGKGQPVCMDVFKLQEEDGTIHAQPIGSRIILSRKDESLKVVGDPLLTRLRTYRYSTAATLAMLTGQTNTNGSTKEDTSTTSCGLTLKLLRKTPIFTCGNSVVMLTAPPGGNNNSSSRSIFNAGSGLSATRTLGTNLCFSAKDGGFTTRVDFVDAPTCSVARGSPIVGLGVCFDATNNFIWTCSSDWVDQWHNPGLRAPHHVGAQMGMEPALEPVPDDSMILIPGIVKMLLHHVGSNCCHRIHSDILQSSLGQMLMRQRTLDVVHLKRVCDILEKALKEEDQPAAQCMFIVLQVLFKCHTFRSSKKEDIDCLHHAGALAWQVLVESKGTVQHEGLQREACNTIIAGLTILYRTNEEQNSLMHRLLLEGEANPALGRLRDLILGVIGQLLRLEGDEKDLSGRLKDELVHLILKISVKEACVLLRRCQQDTSEEFEDIISTVPVASPCLQYMMALQINLLRDGALCNPKPEESSPLLMAEEQPNLEELQHSILTLASKVFTGCEEVLETLVQSCQSISNSDLSDRDSRLQGLERVIKGTMLGHLMPILITALTHENLQSLALADALIPQVVQLVILTSQASQMLVKCHQQDALDNDEILSPGPDATMTIRTPDPHDLGFLASLKIPAPWATGKTVECIHPVRDNYKFRETVHIPGARCLYLRFDPRCATQYDYDKVIVYAGPNSSSRKVSEYGGNTYGFGSRSVLGSGWPKDLVKVEGNTVTFTFEMRSGREHNTPDKAMWGFACTVRAQESTEDASGGMPFLADLALGLSVLACTMLMKLYKGPEKSPEEEQSEHLLKSKLLQRCVWHPQAMRTTQRPAVVPEMRASETVGHSPQKESQILPRIKLSADIMQRLQALSGRMAPHLRPSIGEVIQPAALQEAIVSAALKHLGLEHAVLLLGDGSISEQQRSSYDLLCQVTNGVYRRIYAIQRQLQLLAELEQKWNHDLDEMRGGSLQSTSAFFAMYHQQENKMRELELLAYLKDIDFESADQEDAVKLLREKLEQEASMTPKDGPKETMPKTRSLVMAILERVELLLHVTIATESLQSHPSSLSRSVSQHPSNEPRGLVFANDQSVPPPSPPFTRSVSLPMELEGGKELGKDSAKSSRSRWQSRRKGPLSLLQELAQSESKPTDKRAHAILLDEFFSFIGTNPEQAVSLESFLSAARVRWRRGNTRKQALVHIKQLLLAASKVGGAMHLLAAVTAVIQNGPRVDELACGGMVDEVQQTFSETMTSVVTLAGAHPVACANSIGLLCTIPYTRREEQCLVDSGLVQVLDQLCSLGSGGGSSGSSGGSSESQTTKQRVSALAWAGFQVLASRCVSWEADETSHDALGYAGLARQVSSLLTNHLARATESGGNEAAGSEALQEVLSLLNELSRSRMGKAILSQPACVSKLLSLLLDQRPSPKLVLIILQLCRVALPLMSAEDCASVQLPYWGQEVSTLLRGADEGMEGEGEEQLNDPPAKIASLLLAKLGDYVVPGCQTTASLENPSSVNADGSQATAPSNGDRDKGEESEAQDGRISVFIHKREDQSSHEVIQPLLSSDGRPFRLGSGVNMERVVRMDREMTKYGKAEVFTEDANAAIRKAGKWAQGGLVVSTGPPVESNGESVNENGKEKKKVATEVVCREKNAELARTDPVRPFISGHVANSMASEVIALLHSLLTAPETHTALIWASAVERVLSHALTLVSQLTSQQATHLSLLNAQSQGEAVTRLMSICRQVVAAFCALGGFKESVKVGSKVQVTGEGSRPLLGHVISISEPQSVATVEFNITKEMCIPRANNTLEVPLSRLQPPSSQTIPLQQLSMTERVVSALHSLLLPRNERGMSPLTATLPAVGDGSCLAMASCRVLAEIRSRACAVLSLHMREPSFATEFVKHSSLPVEVLKSLAQQCSSGERVSVVEAQCQRLRMLYRDCARPPPPPAKNLSRMSQDIGWNPSRSFPPPRACLFSHNQTAVTFLGDNNAGSGLPRGVMCYATQPVPNQAPSFYWELEICSNGDLADEAGPSVSFGFAPSAEKKEGAWTNPVGTVLFHNSGRGVHYSGASLLQWKSLRLDVTLSVGDVAGIGWERDGEGGSHAHGQQAKGRVFLTYNGRRLSATLDGVAGGMWPVVHVQKKNTRVRANFGARPFCHAEGRQHHDAAVEAIDPKEEIAANFSILPFHTLEEATNEGASIEVPQMEAVGDSSPAGPPCRQVSSLRPSTDYDTDESVNYKLRQSYNNFTTMGADVRILSGSQDETKDDEEDGDQETQEDFHALLVKAWESKVFPVIRRRFRNEAERRSGLEQIKGALQLGMTDIARQTVEFLYEENGGMPRDLHLPTIEDIKTEAAKFTIDKVRKGTTVVIHQPDTTGSAGSTVVPKFAVRAMLKTFGLTGMVLDIDSRQELVQVETYLRSEGVLVRYWYPLDMLERPHAGYRRGALTGLGALDITNINIHRELLHAEATSARMSCRTALMEFLGHCQSPEVIEVIPCSLTSGQASANPEQDISHLQLLSNQLLESPQPDGALQASSLLTAQWLHQCLASNTRCLADIFYQDTQTLRRELFIAMATAAHMGEGRLLELTNQLCGVLQNAPHHFPCEVTTVMESKLNTDLLFPGASAVIVSCQQDPKTARKEASLYQAPWARVFCYGIGHRVKKTGQTALLEVVSYPADAAINSSAGLSAPPSHNIDPFPTVVLPCNRVHVRFGVSPVPGCMVSLHGLPSEFPLAMAFIETLMGCEHQIGSQKIEGMEEIVIDRVKEIPPERQEILKEKPVQIPPRVTARAVELLAHYLMMAKVPSLIKEYLFHMLAQLLRMLYKREFSGDSVVAAASTALPFAVFTQLRQLRVELRKLFEHESMSGTLTSITPGRQSKYFQSLMELCLALAEVTSPPGSGGQLVPSPHSTLSVQLSPQAAAKRKKVKIRRTGASVKRSPRPSESDSGETSASGSSKPEEMLWFHRTLTVSLILRFLIDGDSKGSTVIRDAILDAHQTNSAPSTHTRLLVITGIPMTLEEPAVRRAIERACRSHGGLYKQELWIPVQEIRPLEGPEESDVTTKPPVNLPGSLHGASVETPGPSPSTDPNMDPTQSLASQPQPSPEQHEGLLTPPPESEITSEQTAHTADTDQPEEAKRRVKGCAVLEVRCKAKMDSIENALLTSKEVTEAMQVESAAILDVSPEDFLTISVISSSLQTELTDNSEFLEYLKYKLFNEKSPTILKTLAVQSLEQIFYSCLAAEQGFKLLSELDEKETETVEVTLSKEQMLSLAPGNLLVPFFGEVKGSKHTTQEEVCLVLEKYGVNRLSSSRPKKPSSKPSKEQMRGVYRRGSKTSKEKLTTAEVSSKAKSPSGADKKTKRPEKVSRDIPEKRHLDDGRAKLEVCQERALTLNGFLQFVTDRAQGDATPVWRALMACGFDLHFDRFASFNHTDTPSYFKHWTHEMDTALVCYVDRLCRKMSITPARLNPHEVYLTEGDLVSPKFASLQGVPLEILRLRFALLQSLSNNLESYFLPLVDLRPSQTLSLSTAALLARARTLLFYDTKIKFFNAILDATAQRNLDQAAPEITLDPLEIVGADAQDCISTQFCQAARQLSTVPSSKLCVKIASGGDPTYAFNVRLTGEEVHGTSGSFRHFLGQVTRELQSSVLGLLVLCPSAGSGRNKGRFLMKPGPITFPEEKLLEFFGQLLGVALRADIPLALDLLASFWKCLVGVALDPDRDLEEADCITYDYIKKLTEVQSESEFDTLCAEVSSHHASELESPDTDPSAVSAFVPRLGQTSHNLMFVYNSLSGEEVELCHEGRARKVSWKNRQQYISAIRDLRLRELACPERMLAVRCGLASVVPIQLLCIMTPYDIELRMCGLPTVDLDFLKAHTMYQVGLVETDTHIQYFWNALESFSQDEICRFIKFACNQERIPCTCPCRDGEADTTHVPPYPMKIAPPDGTSGSPDTRFIRVETCMFMVKLPQYTSQDIMTKRLLYAINCREDPLSG